MSFKNIIGFIAGIIVTLFAVVMCVDFGDESTSNNSNNNSEAGVYDDDDEEVDADAADIYGNAVDDDNSSASTSTYDDDEEEESNWGDGTCHAINTKEYYQLVAKKSNMEDFIGEGPVVVDFWASWCGYCKQIDPYLKALAKKYKGKVQFYKVNADECEAITNAYGIESLPTLFFCNGSDIMVKEGAYSKNELDEMIQELLSED